MTSKTLFSPCSTFITILISPLQIVKLNRFAIVRYHFENFDYFEHKELFSEKFGVKDDFVSLAIT